MKQALKRLLENKLATFCAIVLVIEFIILFLAPFISPFEVELTHPQHKLSPGFWALFSSDPDVSSLYVEGFYLGTDYLGRDVLSRLLMGGRVSIMVGIISTFIGLTFGILFGLLAGYYKKLDNIIMRFMDLLFTFPGVLLAMLVISVLGRSTLNATIAISIWSIPSFARMIRGKVLQIKQEEFILSAKTLGANDFRIMFNHILPNAMPIIIVIATMRMASSIISISTLSYLGMGVPAPAPEWGGMIATAKNYMWEQPSLIIIPGLAVMITVICFNIVGDKLRDILDPSLKN